jgi:glucosamine--fructose-6-phosphate aminotransferase (isomerizing)
MPVPYIEQEIAAQPRVLSAVLSSGRRAVEECIQPGRWKRLHLAGCGDMFFAAEVVSWLARLRLELEVHSWRSMDLRWAAARLGPDDLVVCASVSGRTPRTVEAARAARRRGARVLGITDNDHSPLTGEVDGLVLLETSPRAALGEGPYPGYHHQIGQTKTYTAVLLAEMLAAARAAGDESLDFEVIPERVAGALPALSAAIRAGAGEWFAGRRNVAVLASGPHRGTALYGAAKFLEYAIPAHAQCLEEFNHLEMFLADERTLALVLAPDEPSRRRAVEMLEAWEHLGLRSIVIGPGAQHPGKQTVTLQLEGGEPHVSPFLEALALQILAYRGAVTLGRDPDRWLGGVRTELLIKTSGVSIRGSEVL